MTTVLVLPHGETDDPSRPLSSLVPEARICGTENAGSESAWFPAGLALGMGRLEGPPVREAIPRLEAPTISRQLAAQVETCRNMRMQLSTM